MITVGLIDSYKIIGYGLTSLLHEVYDEINLLKSDSISDFKRNHGHEACDVLLLGNNSLIPEECFQQVIEAKKQFPDIPLIVYDENLKQNLTIRYFELKVDGYLLKQNIASEITNAITNVMNKQQFICPTLLESLLSFVARKEVITKSGALLTPRESEIALYLSQGMKTSWIANTLGRKPSTISTIKNTIFKKMKVDNVVQLKTIFSTKNTDVLHHSVAGFNLG
ncbi:MAG TPA: response regulator transcription factor [Dyadobacter sp.]|jgi:DNA-binding NarL/FixJ family response regulator|nr:response regulator transcription factor [Dyadobacter sp.]